MFEQDIKKCRFVPMSTMKKVLELIEEPPPEPNRRCKQNLLELQMNKGMPMTITKMKWRNRYHLALRRAIYSHDWNKLLYLLKKSPPWEHDPYMMEELPIYVRALTILLMNHPKARELGLLNEYLHLVLSCRSDEDKKAVLKVVLSLPEKIQNRLSM